MSDWQIVDTAADLDRLNGLVCWEDSHTVEFYSVAGHHPSFPDDVCRSGFAGMNLHLLCEAGYKEIAYVELVFIHCEWFTFTFLHFPFFQGRVDSLRRVEIWDYAKSTLMRCARLIYRTHTASGRVRPGFLAQQWAKPHEPR